MNDLLLSLIAVVAFNLAIFPIAFRLQTDKLTDITYSLSFIFLAAFGLLRSDAFADPVRLITASIVIFWAIRLGYFLLKRVSQLGKDARFDNIRVNFKRFLRFFFIQGVSSWIISIPLLILFYSKDQVSVTNIWIMGGWIIAVGGLLLESISDYQKSQFKNMPGNADKFFTGGLYKKIRYPNYLGEILFWIGIFICTSIVLDGIQWLSIVSPIVIILLLTRLSGIPILEKSRAVKYAKSPEYQSYLKNTYLLIPGY